MRFQLTGAIIRDGHFKGRAVHGVVEEMISFKQEMLLTEVYRQMSN